MKQKQQTTAQYLNDINDINNNFKYLILNLSLINMARDRPNI